MISNPKISPSFDVYPTDDTVESCICSASALHCRIMHMLGISIKKLGIFERANIENLLQGHSTVERLDELCITIDSQSC